MTNHLLFLLVAVLACIPFFAGAAASQPASAPAADTSRVPPTRQPDKEILYKKTPQADLQLFAYLPPDWKKTDRRPAIIFFFGGGWFRGSTEQFYSKAEYLASRGLVALCADYRVLDRHQTSMKECVVDARSAMRFVRKNAADLGVDPDKLIASGGSAGGHLAAMLAMDAPDDPNDDLAVSCRPQAMILFNPVLDLAASLENPKTRNITLRVLPGSTDAEKRAALAGLSPVELLDKNFPPTLLLYGDQDDFYTQAASFIRKSRTLGNPLQLAIAPNKGHGFFNLNPWHVTSLRTSDEFLTSLHYLQGSATLPPADPQAQLRIDKP